MVVPISMYGDSPCYRRGNEIWIIAFDEMDVHYVITQTVLLSGYCLRGEIRGVYIVDHLCIPHYPTSHGIILHD